MRFRFNFIKVKKHYFLLISTIYFIIIISLLYGSRASSYNYYERVKFESSGAYIYANLFYPENKLTFQDKHPFVIFTHGLGSQKDLDPRIPIELTKRGFIVASIDYRGDGESTGHLLDINYGSYRNRTNVPAIAQDCSKLLDVIEKHPVYNMINSSQIGIVGHSLGGMVALMTNALDERFRVAVTWAGLVNFSANLFGINESNPFMKFIPARIINATNSQNLLVIHSIYDNTVPYRANALLAQKLTNCELLNITYHILGGPHYLFTDEVLIKTINWFEVKFFNSKMINGPIRLSYLQTYVLLFMALFGVFITTLAIMVSLSHLFIIEKERLTISSNLNNNLNKTHILKQSIKISLYFTGFLIIWILFFTLMGIIGLILAPIFIILIYFIWILVKYIITAEEKKQRIILYIESKLKDEIKSQFRKNVLLYSFVSTIIFLGLYFSLSLSYPFAFFSPINVIDFILTYTIYPFYLAIELFYRKVVYEDLDFIKSPTTKTIITALMGILNIGILMILSYSLFLISAFYMTFLIFLAVMIINSVIYEKTNKFSSVLISSFIIIQIFFGSAVSVIFGFGSLTRLII
ncbi:MAG: alpha/beta fold hydrolase [Candidatus Lokiarchaeota archaeon]|nr:alpha/beta fold hydrolase [Candidatus Lokiarchaeota archaeon]